MTSNLIPFLVKFSIRFVLAKQAAGDSTPPLAGNFSFSFRMVVADSKRATQVAPYPVNISDLFGNNDSITCNFFKFFVHTWIGACDSSNQFLGWWCCMLISWFAQFLRSRPSLPMESD